MRLPTERYAEEKHFSIIQEWWKANDAECLPAECFPKTGCVALHDGKAAAASFCYLTNAKVALIAFTIADPELPPRAKLAATETVIEKVTEMAKTVLKGQGFIFSLTDNAGLHRIYTRRSGFTAAGPSEDYYMLLDESISPDLLI